MTFERREKIAQDLRLFLQTHSIDRAALIRRKD